MRPNHPLPRFRLSDAEVRGEFLPVRPSSQEIDAGMPMAEDARRWGMARARRAPEALTSR